MECSERCGAPRDDAITRRELGQKRPARHAGATATVVLKIPEEAADSRPFSRASASCSRAVVEMAYLSSASSAVCSPMSRLHVTSPPHSPPQRAHTFSAAPLCRRSSDHSSVSCRRRRIQSRRRTRAPPRCRSTGPQRRTAYDTFPLPP
jgi:hypothetical protein